MFSVIIPLYNKEQSITNTIQSVLDQTFQDFEIVVVNDGSTDKSVERVKAFDDPRIRIIDKPNGGVSSARNRGIKEAKYEWIAFLDGDDWWAKSYLLTLNKLIIEYPNAGIYAGRYSYITNKKPIPMKNRFPNIEKGYFLLSDNLYAVSSSSLVIHKNTFDKYGCFDESLTHGEDTDMWIRIGMKESACFDNSLVSFIDVSSNPLTKSTGKIPKLENQLLSKIDNYIGVNAEWDKILIKRKAEYLLTFYLEYPNNRKIKEMIKNLPEYIFDNKRYMILKLPNILIYILHFTKRVVWNISLCENRIKLYFKK